MSYETVLGCPTLPPEALIWLYNKYVAGERTNFFVEIRLDEVSTLEDLFNETTAFFTAFNERGEEPASNNVILEGYVMRAYRMMARLLVLKPKDIEKLKNMEFKEELETLLKSPPFTEEELLTLIDRFEGSIKEAGPYIIAEWNTAQDTFLTMYKADRDRTIDDYIKFIHIFLQNFEKPDDPIYILYIMLLTIAKLHVVTESFEEDFSTILPSG